MAGFEELKEIWASLELLGEPLIIWSIFSFFALFILWRFGKKIQFGNRHSAKILIIICPIIIFLWLIYALIHALI